MNYNNKSSGFSLLELLLAVGVLSVLLTAVAVSFNNWFLDSIDRRVSRQVRDIQFAAENYVDLNFSELLGAMPNVDDVTEVSLDDMRDAGFLPPNYSGINAHRQAMRVLLRHVTASSIEGSVIEVLTVGDNVDGLSSAMDIKRIINAVDNGGPQIGLISDLEISSTCCKGNIQSLNSTWSVPLTAFSSVYVANPSENDGYIAAYGRVSINSDLSNQYLFRLDIPNTTDLNKMETDLDMNGNDIINANIIVSESANVQGRTTLRGMQSNGLESPYVLAVRDDLIAQKNIEVRNNGSDKGNLFINGDDTIGVDFTVTGSMNVFVDEGAQYGVVTAQDIHTDQASLSNIMDFSNLDMNDTSITSENVYARSTRYKGDIATQDLQALNMTGVEGLSASNGVTNSVTINNASGLNANNDLVTQGVLSVDGDADISGTLSGQDNVGISNLRSCGSGCL